MSEPKRYSIVADFQPPWAKMHEFRSGDWVKWEDYARLKAEVERLRIAGEDLAHAVRTKHGVDFALEEWAKVANIGGKPSV